MVRSPRETAASAEARTAGLNGNSAVRTARCVVACEGVWSAKAYAIPWCRCATIQDDYCDAWVHTPSYVAQGLDAQVLSLKPGRPGPHRVLLHVSNADGSRMESCELHWTVPGRGLRIELCWDTSTTADLDLYLHTPHNQNPFFATPSTNVVETLTEDTCNSGNCPAELRFLPRRADFGYPGSPLDYCAEGPAADDFLALGRCPNPRAGADNNQDPINGTAEVIQVDNPEPGGTLRVMVHNFDNLPAEPRVFVFDRDELVAEFSPPEFPSQFVAEQPGTYGVVWRPADVRIQPEAGIVVEALRGPQGASSSVIIDSPAY